MLVNLVPLPQNQFPPGPQVKRILFDDKVRFPIYNQLYKLTSKVE